MCEAGNDGDEARRAVLGSARVAALWQILLGMGLAAVLVGLGIWIGTGWIGGSGIGRSSTRDAPDRPGAVAATDRVPMPSFGPIVDRVRAGVVSVQTMRYAAPSAAETEGDGATSVRGTGIVIDPRGLIVTNEHIVRDPRDVLVTLPGHPDARRAEVVGVDRLTDIAVLRLVEPPADLVALALGDSSEVAQGDWVLAVGNPFGFSQSVTAGVVSYVGRHIRQDLARVSNEFLQFSAPINPGNSGGPVLDMAGRVVGITTSTHPTGRGIAFAVPSKVLRWVLERMETDGGRVRRSYLGLGLDLVDASTARANGLVGGAGAMVRQVAPGSPADEAGLELGDIVVGVGERSVESPGWLYDWVLEARPGQEALLRVMRSQEALAPMAVRLGEVEVGDDHDLTR